MEYKIYIANVYLSQIIVINIPFECYYFKEQISFEFAILFLDLKSCYNFAL